MSDHRSVPIRAYDFFLRSTDRLRSPFLLFVRLYWGWQFIQTGWGKLHNLPHVIEFFTSLNIPFPATNAVFVSGLEFVGGILLILGLGSRLIALPLAFDMFVAYLTADRDSLVAIFSDPGKFYAADPFTFLFASLIILIFGGGLFALDTVIQRVRLNQRVGPKTTATAAASSRFRSR